MQVLVSGATGLVGSALVPALLADGHQVVQLIRPQHEAARRPVAARTHGSCAKDAVKQVQWDPAAGQIDSAGIDQAGPIQAAVHLAGAGIADKRWTPARKQLILDSRVQGTSLLCETLAGRHEPPSVFVCASAVGFYGSRGDERLDESSESGAAATGEACFAGEVVQAWEAATAPLDSAPTVVSLARLGIVLSSEGGALAAQLPFFKAGLGGRIGSGRQWVSWITLHDAVRAIGFLLSDPIAGPVNLTAPSPVTNAEFTKALGRALNRPTLLPIPLPALWTRFGRELTAGLLTSSAHVSPAALTAAGFWFEHPRIDKALAAVLA